MEKIKIPIAISARHIHLSEEDLKKLFGQGYKLTKKRDLDQPDQFAANETVDLEFQGKKIKKVRVIGPTRLKTKLELSLTDCFNLDLTAGSSIVLVSGPKGKIKVKEKFCVNQRHIHLNPQEAKKLKVKQGDMVSVETVGKRSVIFNNVEIRIDDNYKLSLHLDTDEGNAAGITRKGSGTICC